MMDDQKAIYWLRKLLVDRERDDSGGLKEQAVGSAILAIEALAKIRAELEQYRRSPSANAAYFVANVAHLLEPKP